MVITFPLNPLHMKKLSFLLLFLFPVILFQSCSNRAGDTDSRKLVIFHAGSLTVPVKEITAAFEKENPGIKILAEAAGSVACARKITDLNRPCDVMLSADYKVIDKFLIPSHADWNIKFASNELALVYSQNSAYSDSIDAYNWPEILMKEEVRYGRSDPDSDPCGYRTVITVKLAEMFYDIPELSEKMLAKDNRYIRPKETDLLALLETKTIDYIFLYRSVAIQHNLPFINLPDSINLANGNLDGWYRNASVKIVGKKPGISIVQHGESMVYGLTIPNNAPHPDLALEFVRFWLHPEKGQKILEQNGQHSVVPAPSANFNKIPASLQNFALPAETATK